jgi:hypothetical protein
VANAALKLNALNCSSLSLGFGWRLMAHLTICRNASMKLGCRRVGTVTNE